MIWLAGAAYILIGFYLAIRWTLYWHERYCASREYGVKNPASIPIDSWYYAAGGAMALVWPASLIVAGFYQGMRKIINRRYAPAATSQH